MIVIIALVAFYIILGVAFYIFCMNADYDNLTDSQKLLIHDTAKIFLPIIHTMDYFIVFKAIIMKKKIVRKLKKELKKINKKIKKTSDEKELAQLEAERYHISMLLHYFVFDGDEEEYLDE